MVYYQHHLASNVYNRRLFKRLQQSLLCSTGGMAVSTTDSSLPGLDGAPTGSAFTGEVGVWLLAETTGTDGCGDDVVATSAVSIVSTVGCLVLNM